MALRRLVVLVVAVAAPAGPAVAQDKPWSAEATLASEYISKGVGRSDGQPHVALQVQRTLTDSIYVGVWTGTLRSPLGADGESHLYAGWRPRLGAWRMDLRPMFKVLSNAQGNAQTEQWEVRADGVRAVAGARLRLRVEHTFDGYGPSKASTWMEANLSREVGENGWAVTGGLGRREQEVGRDYTAWNVGVQRRMLGPISADLRWVDTDQEHGGREYKGRFVVGLTAALR